MKRILRLLVVAAALACKPTSDNDHCNVSTDCPIGQYCAASANGGHCTPDAVAPTVSGVTASCTPAPCLRDSVLHVEAIVSDDKEVLEASVSVDLDPTQKFPLSSSGGLWIADVPLRVFPFDAFTGEVVPTVSVRDGARNSSAPASGAGVPLTRLKWTYTAGVALTSPAVMSDGTVVVGGINGILYFVAADGTEAQVPLGVGTGQITVAPSIGQHAIWVGSEDGNLYAVTLKGTYVLPNVGGFLGAPIKGSVAVTAAVDKDTAFATNTLFDNTGVIAVATSVATGPRQFDLTFSPDGFTGGPVIAVDGHIHALSIPFAGGHATLRSFTLSEMPLVCVASWTAGLGRASAVPLAIDAGGGIMSADDFNFVLNRTVPGPAPVVTTVGDYKVIPSDSAVVAANGDVIAGDAGGTVHRFGPKGEVWSVPPVLGSTVFGPLVLTGTTAPFIVPSNVGKVYALAENGTIKWQGALPSAAYLRAGNIFTPSSQPPGPTMSLAYFSSGNGHLYAVIVDGRLDGSSPWPKAFHDPRNTNHAGPQP
jgi:putative pyrroloquinoline-quinone-binding quinoprotein